MILSVVLIYLGCIVIYLLICLKKKHDWKSGTRVIITGGSSGIGEELSYQFASKGAQLFIVARREIELKRVSSKCNEILKANGFDKTVCSYFVADLTDKNQVLSFEKEVRNKLDGIDILVLNAGISMDLAFDEINTLDDMDSVFRPIMEINFFSLCYLVKAFSRQIRESQGQIVAISSGSGVVGMGRRTGYVASKHAVHGFLNALRNEWANTGVTVSIICPGFVDTPIRQNALSGGRAKRAVNPEKKSMSAKTCAEKIISAILEKRRVYHLSMSGFAASLLYPFPLLMDVADYVARKKVKVKADGEDEGEREDKVC